MVGRFVVATGLPWAGEGSISVTSVDAMLKQTPMQTAGPTAKVSGSSQAGNSELQVIEMSKIKLHHHDQEDYVGYVARGRGILSMGEKGQETREVKPGDILDLPRGCPTASRSRAKRTSSCWSWPPRVGSRSRIRNSTNNWTGPQATGRASRTSRGCAPRGEHPVPAPSAHPAILYGWVIVATTFLIALVTVGGRSAFGVFVVPMREEFGSSRSTISLAAAIGFLVNGLSQPFVGRLSDTLGGRKVILASLATFGLMTILLALTNHTVFLIVVFGVLMSIAWSGTSLTTTSTLLSRWFQRRRATVLSLSTAGASAGGLLLVPLAMAVLQQTGWRMTWVALGVLVLVVAWPLACFFLQDDPTNLGLLPDGDQPSADSRQVNPTRAAAGPLEAGTWRVALRSWPFWQLTGAYFVCGFTTAILTTHFIPYAIDRGLAPLPLRLPSA